MSDSKEFVELICSETLDVEIDKWVEQARKDPTLYRSRQVAEIVLTAIGLSNNLKEILVLKGGTAMALAFRSQRLTGDIDFTSTVEPADLANDIEKWLNDAIPKAIVTLGYFNILCKVQSIKRRPRPENFENHEFPALQIKVGSAVKGTREEKQLKAGTASNTLLVEISFRDQVFAFQNLSLSGVGVSIRAFTIHEIISEKYRALIQQTIRNRNRRQDIYDISYLINERSFSKEDKELILNTIIDKCTTRNIIPNIRTLENPEIKERASKDWKTLELEIDGLPEFEESYEMAADFYKSLPWANSS